MLNLDYDISLVISVCSRTACPAYRLILLFELNQNDFNSMNDQMINRGNHSSSLLESFSQ